MNRHKAAVVVDFHKAMEVVVIMMVEVERDGGLGAVEKSKPEVGAVMSKSHVVEVGKGSALEVEVMSISQEVVVEGI